VLPRLVAGWWPQDFDPVLRSEGEEPLDVGRAGRRLIQIGGRFAQLDEEVFEARRQIEQEQARLEADWASRLGPDRYAHLRATLRDLIASVDP